MNRRPRFYDITKGKLLIDGRVVDNYTLISLRNNISLVTQEVILFNDTIFNNVAYGPFTEEQTLKAISAANMDEFVDKLPDGLQTKVGDQGILLSGGQRQRIAIARAIILKPRFLILDEPTSALDLSVQFQIVELLKKLQKENNLGYIFISHDLRVIKSLAHKIIVLKNGKIVEKKWN